MNLPPQFERDRPIFLARSPGRLDLMGGNVDYTGGLVFQATIRESTRAAVQLRSDETIVLINPQMSEHRLEFRLSDLTTDEAVRALVSRDRWPAYVLGIFHLLRRRYPNRSPPAPLRLSNRMFRPTKASARRPRWKWPS